MKKILIIILVVILCLLLSISGLFAYWVLRSNSSHVRGDLEIEVWEIVQDGMHNSNTDMIFYNNAFYIIYASSPFHFASEECKLLLKKSQDGKNWTLVETFFIPGEDIRDPKFAVINDQFFIYVLKNTDFTAEPYSTAYTSSIDGENWSDIQDIEPEGWLFWRPKTRDNQVWYCPAYWYEHGESILLQSTDGINWEKVSQIYSGERNDETAIEFLLDGRMIATARLEVSDDLFGDENASTLIAVANYPYKEWNYNKSYVTRLDGPCLFSYQDQIYAVGRRNPESPAFLNNFGSILGTKRTSLFKVKEDQLIYISDLPSAGDTSYAGCVIQDKWIYICYYTSDIKRDYPWIIGMLGASDILMAKVNLESLAKLTFR